MLTVENRRGVDADALAAIKRHILGVLEAGSWRDWAGRKEGARERGASEALSTASRA